VNIRPLLLGTALTGALALLFAGALLLALHRIIQDLPRLPDHPRELGIRPGTEIFAASGQRIYTFNQSRQWVPLAQMSPYALQALIATEDVDFYHHRGINLKAIAGAARDNLLRGFRTRGGSTLTQQLVKRLFLSPEKTLRRKLSEALLAVQLETLFAQTYPDTTAIGAPAYKDRLLELYLNEVFYGANAYGIHDAAATFFGRAPEALSLPQAALLMGLINAPTAYNPLRRPKRATLRLQHVLDRMIETGHLDTLARHRYADLNAEDLIAPGRVPLNPVPYWVEAIKSEVSRRWSPEALRFGGLQIHTTLDIDMQQAAEAAVAKGLAALDQRLGFKPYAEAALDERRAYVQAALVCLAPTGEVLAMVGGRDIFISYYNRALTGRRQPGSGFKPVAYLAALEAGVISPVSLFLDEERSYRVNGKEWRPRNYGGRFLGPTTAAWALIHSANSTAVQVSEKVGPEKVVDLARRMGFAGPIGAYKSIALGVAEVTVLEMAAAYGALANYGLLAEPSLVERVIDAEGQTLFAHAPQIRQAIAPDLAAQMVHLLRQAVNRGTGRRVRALGFDRPVAGKTGTTNDNTDAWFTGFTPDLVASVWVGFDDRREHRLVDARGVQITGGSGAAPIWTHFMKEANAGRPRRDFVIPDEVEILRVDPITGLEASEHDSLAVEPLEVALRRGERPNSAAEVTAFDSLHASPDSLGSL
jgi:penicillin-binding protein 1A